MKALCDNCEEQQELLHCIECGYDLCQPCIQSIHQRGKFQKHIQVPINSAPPQEDMMSPQLPHQNLDGFSFGQNSAQVYSAQSPLETHRKNFDLILKIQQEQEQSIFSTNEHNLKVFTCGKDTSQSQGIVREQAVQDHLRKSLNEKLVRLQKGDSSHQAAIYDFYHDFQFDYMNIKSLLSIVKEEKQVCRFYFLIYQKDNTNDLTLLQNMFRQEFNFHKKSVAFLLYQGPEHKTRRLSELALLLRAAQLVFLISHDPMVLCEALQEHSAQELSVVVIQRPQQSSQEIKNYLYVRSSPAPRPAPSEISAFTFGQFTPQLSTTQLVMPQALFNAKSTMPQPSQPQPPPVSHSTHREMEMQFPIHLEKDSEDTLKMKGPQSVLEHSDKQMTASKAKAKEESFYDKLQLDLSDMVDEQQRNKSDIGANAQPTGNLKESLSNNDLRKPTNQVLLEQFSMQSSSIRYMPEEQVILDNHQKFLDVPVQDSLQLSYHLQNFLMEGAEQGTLFIEQEQFSSQFNRWAEKHKTILHTSAFPALIKECAQKKILQLVIRQFGNSQEFRFVTLRLRSISYQALVWVLRSLRMDRMSATHKNITNRFKEAFGYRLEPALCTTILQRAQEEEFQIVIGRFGFPSLVCTDQQVVLQEGTMEQPQDTGPLQEQDEPLWKVFLNFVDDFFESKGKERNMNLAEKRKWSTSIKSQNAVEHSQSSSKKNQSLPPRSLDRAIPGGKYGCAQLLKFVGPECLRKESLGKLNQIVGEAISRKVIVYFKTLLVKNNNLQKESRLLSVRVEEGQESSIKDSYVKQKVEAVRGVIRKLLQEHKHGIPLSKLPKYLQTKLDFAFDLHELGFPKLKSLLLSMDELFIQNEESSKAVLRAREQQGTTKHKNKAVVQKDHSDSSSQQNRSWNGIVTPKHFAQPKKLFGPSSGQSNTQKKNDKIFNKQIENEIILCLSSLLKNNQQHVCTQLLESLLSNQLPAYAPLDFDQLGYQDFNDFLFKKFKNLESVQGDQGNLMVRMQQECGHNTFYTPDSKQVVEQAPRETSRFFKSCPQNKQGTEQNVIVKTKVLFGKEDMQDLQEQHEQSIIQNVLGQEEGPRRKKMSVKSKPVWGGPG